MRSLRLQFVLVALATVCGSERGFAAAEESIVDQAASSPEFRRKLIAKYESKTNDFRDDRLLAVAVGYAEEQKYDRARLVYEWYLGSNPLQPRALRGLGTIHALQKSYAEATNYLRKAWALGDVKALITLASAYVTSGNFAGMDDLVPALLQRKAETPKIANCLVAYVLGTSAKSGKPLNTRLLLDALDGLPDQDILKRDDTAELVSETLRRLDSADPAQRAIWGKVTRGYEADPPNWPSERRCEVADVYALEGQWMKAEAVYRAVLAEAPNDVDALRGFGTGFVLQRRFGEGLPLLRKAWKLGDSEALSGLAGAYLGLADYTGMKDLVPSLEARKAEDLELRNPLIIYAMKTDPPDRELFYRAIEGISDEEIARREDTTQIVAAGLKYFGEKERAERLLKLKKEQPKPKKA